MTVLMDRVDGAGDPEGHHGRVVVVGMGIALPGASDPEEFWEVLHREESVFSEPGERFRLESFWSPDKTAPDRTYARTAGYLRGLRPHPGLAADLEEGRFTLSDAATWLRHSLLGARDGVRVRAGYRQAWYVGALADHGQMMEETALVETVAVGTARHLGDPRQRGRLRRLLGERFPSAAADPAHATPTHVATEAARGIIPPGGEFAVLDTACSSSLYAVDLGMRSLLAGDCDIAFCGGVNMLGPRYDVLFAKLNGLTATGDLRSFDRDANGTVFSDGAAVVALKRSERAIADGDKILGVIVGSGVGADGAGKAIYAPSPAGQRRCISAARSDAGIPADQVDWILAHGTGTPVGDVVEMATLTDLAGENGHTCTSNKSLIGHAGWACGAVSLIHVLLALRHGEIPAQRRYSVAAEGILGKLRVPTADQPWPASAGRSRVAGISAFGFGGTNTHLIVTDRPTGRPRPKTTPAAQDPVVAVAWSCHLPGDPEPGEMLQMWDTQVPGQRRGFGDNYPLPSFAEARLSPPALRSMDRSQLMALRVAARFAAEHGALWETMPDGTGVFSAHTGPQRASLDNLTRCYATELDMALEGEDATALAAFVAQTRATFPASNADTLPGILPGIIAARFSKRYDLRGPALQVDTGDSSGLTAIHIASRYLHDQVVDLALVLGLNANTRPEAARYAGTDDLAEGAFLLALCRMTTARRHNWPVLASVTAHTGTPEAPGPPDPVSCLRIGGVSYRGGTGVASVIHALRDLSKVHRVVAEGQPVVIDVAPVPPDLPPQVAHPHEIHLSADRGLVVREPAPAIPPAGLVLASEDVCTETLTAAIAAAGAHLVTIGGDDDESTVGAALRAAGDVAHIRVLTSLRDADWPQAPCPSTLLLHEAAYRAAAVHRDRLRQGGSYAMLLLDPLTDGLTHPHTALFTGLVRALAWEIPASIPFAVVTDTRTVTEGLVLLQRESRLSRTLPIAYYRAGTRLTETFHPHPVTSTGPDLAGLTSTSVVVAVGGGRGITAACLTDLARTIRPRIWLLGSGDPDQVPEEILTATDAAVAAGRSQRLAAALRTDPQRGFKDAVHADDQMLRAREVARTLAALREACGPDRVRHLVCDVCDPRQVHAAAALIRAAGDDIDLLIHGAGLRRAGALGSKSGGDFRAVRDVKVLGYAHLKAAFTDPEPRRWCTFGSSIGAFGMSGEADYAAANDFAAAAARYEHHVRGRSETTIAWGLWGETGLATDALKGPLLPMTTAEGVRHFRHTVMASAADERGTSAVPLWLADRERRILTERTPGVMKGGPPPGSPPRTTRLPAAAGSGGQRWTVTATEADIDLTASHLVDGRPTVAGLLLAEYAVDAATRLHPHLTVVALLDVQFRRFARHRRDGSPPRLWIEARPCPPAQQGTSCVAVTIGSDPAPGVPAQRIEHATMTVVLAPHPSAAVWWYSDRLAPGSGVAVRDPYQQPGGRLELSGPFAALRHAELYPGRSAAVFDLTGVAVPDGLAGYRLPVLALDSLLRIAVLSREVMSPAPAAPLVLPEIHLRTTCNDLELADLFGPLSLIGETDPVSGVPVLHAVTADNRVLLTITDPVLATPVVLPDRAAQPPPLPARDS